MNILALLISFAVYLLTLCPTFSVGDSAELISASYTLGIAHPSGYPLYCIIVKIFTLLIPVSNIAYRANLMSAVFASLTVFLLFLLIFRLIDSQFQTPHSKLKTYAIAFSSSLCFAFSQTFWTQSVTAEVYTLNAFFVILTFYLLISNANLFIFALVYGLSLTNHHSMILLAPVYAIYIAANTKLIAPPMYRGSASGGKSYTLNAIMFFLLGLSLYLYLPLRAGIIENINWGDPSNIGNFLIHVLRKQFTTIGTEARSFDIFKGQILVYLTLLSKQFTPFVLLFAILGIATFPKKNQSLLLALSSSFLITSVGIILIINPRFSEKDIFTFNVFYIPSYIIITVLIAYALFFIVSKTSHPATAGQVGLATTKNRINWTATFLILPLIPLFFNFKECNLKNNFIAYNYGMNILKTVEPKSALITQADNSDFSLLYLTEVEKTRTDITIHSKEGNLFKKIYGKDFPYLDLKQKEFREKIIEQNLALKNQQLYYIYYSSNDPIGLQFINKWVKPQGCLYKIVSADETRESTKTYNKIYNFRSLYGNKRNYLENDIFTRYTQTKNLSFPQENLNKWLFDNKKLKEILKNKPDDFNALVNLGIRYADAGNYIEAFLNFNKALAVNQGNSLAYKCLGNIYYLTGDRINAITCWEKYSGLNPKDSSLKDSLDELKKRTPYNFDKNALAPL